MQTNVKIFILPTQPIATNSIVIAKDGACVIFDPSGDASWWIQWITSNNLNPRAIFLTHGHFDHILALFDLCEKYNVPWYMNPKDKVIMKGNNALGFLFGGYKVKIPKQDFIHLKDGMRIEILSGLYADVISTPGHTPGGVCFNIPDLNLLITGDTIFADAVGRTDLPLGNQAELLQSIEKLKYLNLPISTRIIPGHGAETTLGRMRIENIFFR